MPTNHTPSYARVQDVLEQIRSAISDREYTNSERRMGIEGWGGAGVAFVTTPPTSSGPGDPFYPEPRLVITAHAHSLGWLLDKLGSAFVSLLDSSSKIEFFGRLTNAATRYLNSSGVKTDDAEDILVAVWTEARLILTEMEAGTFEWLEIAPGGAIVDDIKKR